MKKRAGFKADLFIFAFIAFLGAIAFSMFVLDNDPEARRGLFGISVWLLIIVGAIYWRNKKNFESHQVDQKETKSE